MSSPCSCDQIAAAPADGLIRIVADLAAGDVRQLFIQQRGQHADDARLGLPAQSEQDEIVPRENRVDDLRNHRIFVADDAGKQSSPRCSLQIRFWRSSSFTLRPRDPLFGKVAGFQSAKGRR